MGQIDKNSKMTDLEALASAIGERKKRRKGRRERGRKREERRGGEKEGLRERERRKMGKEDKLGGVKGERQKGRGKEEREKRKCKIS